MIQEIIMYKTTDGSIFKTKQDATERQENLLGEALDNLLPGSLGNPTRSDRHKVLMDLIDPKNRASLINKINDLYNMLNTKSFEYDIMDENDREFLNSYR